MPFALKVFDCRSSGNALVYLPLMIEATSAGVAILLRKRSFGLGAFRCKVGDVIEMMGKEWRIEDIIF